jgi:hypothetical protein
LGHLYVVRQNEAADNDEEARMKLQKSEIIRRDSSSALATDTSITAGLSAGDLVRIRSREEIEATLDGWKELKGCSFMSEMWMYCGTTQRVLKPVNRFLDERDYKIRKCSGIVLLEGVICQGRAYSEGCDYCCFIFWREEWLERIPEAKVV